MPKRRAYARLNCVGLSVVGHIEAGGGKVVVLQLDVAVPASFRVFREAMRQALHATWDRPTFDCLVNNAGVGLFNPIETVTRTRFGDLLNVHLKGPFFLTQALSDPRYYAANLSDPEG